MQRLFIYTQESVIMPVDVDAHLTLLQTNTTGFKHLGQLEECVGFY